MSDQTGTNLIVSISAIGGLFSGLIGSGLGIYNCIKAKKKESKEKDIRANQHLVKAKYSKGHTETNRLASDLFVINTDTRPVTGVKVDFCIDPGKPQMSKEIASLSPGEPVLIYQFTRGTKAYKSAEFVYMDADGHKHEYTQESI